MRTASSDLDRAAALVVDSTLFPYLKNARNVHAPKLLRSQLNEGAYLVLLPGQVRNDRTAPVPSQRRRTFAEALVFK